MFDAIRNNRRIVQIILAAIILSFAFFGIESYLRDSGGGREVATVAGTNITLSEFERALQQQQERIRGESSQAIDDKLFQSEGFKSGVLKNLIDQRLLLANAGKSALVVSDAQIQETISAIPAFQRDGRFDVAQYDQALRAQGLNQTVFEGSIRQELASRQIFGPVADGGMVTKAGMKLLLQAQAEQREVSYFRISVTGLNKKSEVSDGEIQKYYEQNGSLFDRPARLRAEFTALDPHLVEKSIAVTDQEALGWYEEHKDRYATPEERSASHILLQVSANATESEMDRVRQAAVEILERIKADPKSFESIARERSQDSGSADRGGDLGYFRRGSMVKGFEDAVFGLREVSELAGPVRTEFGFHIVKLTGIRPSKVMAFADVQTSILGELRKESLSRRYGEAAEQFANLVYEQPDSLKPAADQLKLKIEASDWIESGTKTLGPHASDRLIQALFSHDSLEGHRNTEAVDVGGGVLVAARVIEYQAARRLGINEVRKEIVAAIDFQSKRAETAEEGQRILTRLKGGERVANAEFSVEKKIQRGQVFENDPEVTKKIFSISQSSIPGFIGHQSQNGDFLIIKVSKVLVNASDENGSMVDLLRKEYQKILGRLALDALLNELGDRFGVKYGAHRPAEK
ncbi:MAG: SurA N-terminal domain-containing protein [Zoogloeaceae bacterium]|nr:SurA N-terminal domain-containing protein [Zoogloeaceae bacterium]